MQPAASVGVIILSPRDVATGSPAGAALENINTNPIANGALCYVASGPGQGEWQLQKEATDAPDGVTIVAPISGPGRWFIKLFPGPGGGGGGGITAISGSGGITITNPAGPVATVVGSALYARNGSNGAMLANVNMGTFGITNASGITGTAGLNVSATGGNVVVSATLGNILLTTAVGGIDVLSAGQLQLTGATLKLKGGATNFTWPGVDGTAGQALVTNGAGVLSFATVGGGGTPAAPANSIQYNNAGAFGGTSEFTFFPSGGGFGAQVYIQSATPTTGAGGYYLLKSTSSLAAYFAYNENLNTTTLSGENLSVRSTTGGVHIGPGVSDALLLNAATVASIGTNKVLSWNGTENVYITPPFPAPTIQNITVAGPTNVTDTMNTVALVNFAGASSVVLPPHAIGKQATVKDKSGAAATNNITITAPSGSVDGVGSQIIATNRGSMTFVSDGTDWWAI